jgi:hypothetical protein
MLTMTHLGDQDCRYAVLFENGSYEKGNCDRGIDSRLMDLSSRTDGGPRACYYAWTAPWGSGSSVSASSTSPCNTKYAKDQSDLSRYVFPPALPTPVSPVPPVTPQGADASYTFWQLHGYKFLIAGGILGAVAVGGIVYKRKH